MKSTILIAAVALCAVLPGGPAGAASGCKPYELRVIPETDAPNPEDALAAEVFRVTDKATEQNPLVIEYEHGASMVFPLHQGDQLLGEASYFSFQVDTRSRRRTVNVRAEWPTPSASDIDIYAIDRYGEQMGASESANTHVEEAIDGSGGPGFESILGLPMKDCAGFTLESQGSATLGEQMTLKVWLSH